MILNVPLSNLLNGKLINMDFRMLKKLMIISLVILFLPFLQTCSDKEIMRNSFLRDSPLLEPVKATESEYKDSVLVIIDKDSKEKEFQYTFDELKKKKQITVNKFLKLRNEFTKNGYQLGFKFVQGLEIADFIESINVICLPFFLILVIVCLLIYFTFKKKTKILLILSILNLLLLLINILLYYLSETLEDINQIKFGYYLFVINSILIIIESYKLRKSKFD